MSLYNLEPPILIAHRGDKSHCPENTLVSFAAALDDGAEMIELDIALSRDRRMVVIHDDSLDRTTNGSGLVADLSLSELKALDAGSWFDPRFAGERIPTLAEVLEMVRQRALVNIEIKKSAFEPSAPEDAIENQLLELVAGMNLENHVLISSFETRFLQRIARANPELALAAISLEPGDEKTVMELTQLGCYSWHGWYEIMTAEQVAMIHAAGCRVFSFTVNEPDLFARLSRMGVDGVFTDDCTLLRSRL